MTITSKPTTSAGMVASMKKRTGSPIVCSVDGPGVGSSGPCTCLAIRAPGTVRVSASVSR